MSIVHTLNPSLLSSTVNVEYWGPRLAKSILVDMLGVKRGETVTIEGWTRAIPWIESFLIEARRIGAHPMVIYESDRAFWKTIEEGRAEELGKIGAQELAALKATNAYIFFWGPSDRARYHKLPKKVRDITGDWEDNWFKVAKEKRIRFCRVELTRTTEDLAKEYGLDLGTWEKELLEATVVDTTMMHDEGQKIANRFAEGRDLLITHPNGTRLELRLLGRKPYVDDGVVDDADLDAGYIETNAPSGVVMTAVDETHASGTIKATRLTRYGPSMGSAEGGVWVFKDGKLAKYSFDSGTANFERLFKKAGKEKYTPAILSIGLNPKIRISPLFEDQQRGTVAFYVGSNEWLGGKTKGDFRTWLLLQNADVTIDGKPLLKAGKIV